MLNLGRTAIRRALPCVVAAAMLGALGATGWGATGCKKSEAATEEGRALFSSACARCHGPEGSGGLPLWDGGPSPRNFHDREFQLSHTDEQIKLTIINGKGAGMPPFGTTFNDEQLGALVGRVRGFDPGTK